MQNYTFQNVTSFPPLIALPPAMSTSISLSCYTQLTNTLQSTVSTRYYPATTTYLDISQTVTSTPISTITPNATTITDVITATSTQNITITSTPSAVTVPTPDGFTPYADTATAIAKHKLRRSDVDLVPRADPGDGTQLGFVVGADGNLTSVSMNSFPFKVFCDQYVFIETISTTTVTADTAYTTVAASTVTAFATTTIVVTNTQTNVLPAATSYAACSADNVVDSMYGRGLAAVYYTPPVNVRRQRLLNATSGYDCCASCIETQNCAGAFYYDVLKQCHITLSKVPVTTNGTNGTIASYCANGSNTAFLGIVFSSSALQPGEGIVVSNGLCGNFHYGWNIDG